MSLYTALLDANVLYPAPMRDILMELAVGDFIRQDGRMTFTGNGLIPSYGMSRNALEKN